MSEKCNKGYTNKRGWEGMWQKGGTGMKEGTKLLVECLVFITLVYDVQVSDVCSVAFRD